MPFQNPPPPLPQESNANKADVRQESHGAGSHNIVQGDHGTINISPAEDKLEGLLVPSNDPNPPISKEDENQISKAAMRIYFGDSLGVCEGDEFALIRISGKDVLTVRKSRHGILVDSIVSSRDGRIVAQIKDNRFFINPNNYFRRERPDRHTLVVYDQCGGAVLNVRLLNPHAIKILGTWHFQNHTPLIIRETSLQFDGLHLSRAFLKGRENGALIEAE